MEKVMARSKDRRSPLPEGSTRREGTGFFHELLEKPVEITTGLIILVAGILLPLTADTTSGSTQALSTLLIALAGVLLAYVGTSIKTREEAAKEFRLRLGGISSHLAASVEQLQSALVQMQSETTTIETFSTVVSLSCQDLKLIWTQIEPLSLEGNISSDARASVEEALREIRRFAPAEADGQDIEKIEALLKKTEKTLEDLVSSDLSTGLAKPSLSTENVTCEACREQTSVLIAPVLGASAHTTCESCGTRLNVHYGPQGVFSKVSSTRTADSGTRPLIRFKCASCGQEMRAVKHPDEPVVQRVCAVCTALLTVDSDTGEVFDVEVLKPEPAAIIGRQGSRPVVECDGCGDRLPSSLRRDGTKGDEFFAFCRRCHQIFGPHPRLSSDEMRRLLNVST